MRSLLLPATATWQIIIDKEGKSALHWAATTGSFAVAKVILDYWMTPGRRNPGEAELNVDVLNMLGKSCWHTPGQLTLAVCARGWLAGTTRTRCLICVPGCRDADQISRAAPLFICRLCPRRIA